MLRQGGSPAALAALLLLGHADSAAAAYMVVSPRPASASAARLRRTSTPFETSSLFTASPSDAMTSSGSAPS